MSGEDDKPRSRGLGRGLSALLGEGEAVDAVREADASASRAGVRLIPIEYLAPNPDQPRKSFDEAELDELAASIADKGL
jgi:ParB family chromosome partitioning protein